VSACEGGPLPSGVVDVFEQAWIQFYGAGYSQYYSIPLP
jgi:hypothetical protein